MLFRLLRAVERDPDTRALLEPLMDHRELHKVKPETFCHHSTQRLTCVCWLVQYSRCRLPCCTNHFLFIKNKCLFISSEGFSTLERCPVMLSEGNAAHPIGCDSPLQIVMAVWRPFCLNSNFLDQEWQPSADNNSAPKGHLQRANTRPDHSA